MISLTDAEKAHSRKVLVGVIDSNGHHRAQMVHALISFYRVAEYPSPAGALAELVNTPPCVLLIDVEASVIDRLVSLIRSEPRLKDVPIVYTGHPEDCPGDLEIDAYLRKPFRRSVLIQTISKLVNKSIEGKWENLLPLQKAALRQSLDMFNGISDLIDDGQPLLYDSVNTAVQPLIQSVQNDEYKELLWNVRDHDNYTYVHSLRSATLLSLFGHNIGLSGEEMNVLSSGGLLYDIGKMSIPFEVLNKPGQLSEDELDLMHSHVRLGEDYLRNHSDVPKGVLIIASQHHEMLDGTGYPLGMKNGALNELARMAAIVDVFGALTDRRIYKNALPAESALNVMTSEMAGALDQNFIAQFREMLLDAVIDESYPEFG